MNVFQSILVCCISFCDTCGDVTGERDAVDSNQGKCNTDYFSEDGLMLGRKAQRKIKIVHVSWETANMHGTQNIKIESNIFNCYIPLFH